jgi:hypothetical protein
MESRTRIVFIIIIIATIAITAAATFLICTSLLPAGANNSQENPSLSDLNKAISDPEFIELLGKRNLTSIDFSTLTDYRTKEEYRQLVFHPEDPDPDDNLAPSMIIVKVNESGEVFSVYETYPAYIPPLVGE